MDVATPRAQRPGILRRLARHPKICLLAGAVLIATGSWVWWATQLWGLPDLGDPFDVEAFEAVRVPDERNAFVEYRHAVSLHSGIWRKFRLNKSAQDLERPTTWAEASEPWREYLAESSEVLRIWRIGTDKPDSLYEHPEGLTFRTGLPVTQDLRWISQLSLLEASRLEAEGDMAGAWGWYRSTLRLSRHCGRNGFLMERNIGVAIHNQTVQALTRWATNPKVSAPLLRQVLAELAVIDRMTVPMSDTLKTEYLLFLHELENPHLIEDILLTKNDPFEPADWCQDLPISPSYKQPIQAVRVTLANDRERSLRIVRLMIANWLAQVDKPPSQRSKLFRKTPPIYDLGPDEPPASRALSPEKLSEWLDSSLLAARQSRWLDNYTISIDRERNRQARLVVHLASQLYQREHGQPPASPQVLVGPDLKALPEGYDTVEDPPKPGR